MEVGGQRYCRGRFSPGKTRYPLCRRLRGPQSRSGQVRKISPPPGLDPRTVQPVESLYTDWALQASQLLLFIYLFIILIQKVKRIRRGAWSSHSGHVSEPGFLNKRKWVFPISENCSLRLSWRSGQKAMGPAVPSRSSDGSILVHHCRHWWRSECSVRWVTVPWTLTYIASHLLQKNLLRPSSFLVR
jgi:hypothetical protein